MSETPETIKVVLVGQTHTGKTSLISRLIDDNYNDNFISTSVASNSTKTFTYTEQELTLDIWDTAGQEQFRALNKVFYKNAIIVILVYDITERKTFEELVNYWYNEIKDKCIKNPSK